VPCAATPAGADAGSDCDLATDVNSLLPNALTDGNRAILEATAPIAIYDGGPDDDAETKADNAIFMGQGVFVP